LERAEKDTNLSIGLRRLAVLLLWLLVYLWLLHLRLICGLLHVVARLILRWLLLLHRWWGRRLGTLHLLCPLRLHVFVLLRLLRLHVFMLRLNVFMLLLHVFMVLRRRRWCLALGYHLLDGLLDRLCVFADSGGIICLCAIRVFGRLGVGIVWPTGS